MRVVNEGAMDMLEMLYERVKSGEYDVLTADISPRFIVIPDEAGKVDWKFAGAEWCFGITKVKDGDEDASDNC